jgi:hypothetical protein
MRDMHPMREVNLRVDGLDLDFDLADDLARQVASKVEGETMLLAWLDRKAGRECPEVRECMHKPGWLAYARGHGGDLSVVVNDGEYIFVFCPVERT